jgi:hypothetical protein
MTSLTAVAPSIRLWAANPVFTAAAAVEPLSSSAGSPEVTGGWPTFPGLYFKSSRLGVPYPLRSKGWDRWRPDLNRPLFAKSVISKTAPAPQLWRSHQATLHGITMHVSELLDVLALGEHVKIMGARLPERPHFWRFPQFHLIGRFPLFAASSRHSLFQHLHHASDISFRRLAYQDMKVLRHDYVAPHDQIIFMPDFFEYLQEIIATACGTQKGLATITTTSNEMSLAGIVKTTQPLRHRLLFYPTLCCAKEWGTPCLVGEGKPGDWVGHPPNLQGIFLWD